MLVSLLTCLLLGSPPVPIGAKHHATWLSLPPAPDKPGLLRDVIWPALGAGDVGGWWIEPSQLPLEKLLHTSAQGAGVLWATREAETTVQLHRVLFAPGTHLIDTLTLPETAPTDAIVDAVRLRLQFVLSASQTAGELWKPAERALPMPVLVSVAAAHRDELVTRRAPPVPRRTARVPEPPPALPVVPEVPDETLGKSVDRPVEMGVGFNAMVSSGGLDAGLAGRLAVPVGALWWIGGSGRLYPFHDDSRDGRPIGITGYSAFVDVERQLWIGSASRLSGRIGAGVDGLSVVGAGARSDGPLPALSLSVPARFALFGPVALDLDAGLTFGLGDRRVLHGDDVLASRGSIQARIGALLGWSVR